MNDRQKFLRRTKLSLTFMFGNYSVWLRQMGLWETYEIRAISEYDE